MAVTYLAGLEGEGRETVSSANRRFAFCLFLLLGSKYGMEGKSHKSLFFYKEKVRFRCLTIAYIGVNMSCKSSQKCGISSDVPERYPVQKKK